MTFQFSNTVCEIHLWKYVLNNSQENISNKIEFLSSAEQKQFHRLINEKDRNCYLSVRFFMRDVLSKYLNVHAGDIEFIEGINKKPFLKAGQSDIPVFFNLSYSDNCVLLGVSNSEFIGVDVEKIKKMDDYSSFVKHYFSTNEQEIFFHEEKEEQLALLFTMWTMKEAVIKALSVSFTKPLATYNISLFLKCSIGNPDFDPNNVWHVIPVNFGKEYKAAFAIRAEKINLEIFEYYKT